MVGLAWHSTPIYHTLAGAAGVPEARRIRISRGFNNVPNRFAMYQTVSYVDRGANPFYVSQQVGFLEPAQGSLAVEEQSTAARQIG
jgi:hypothetical protein